MDTDPQNYSIESRRQSRKDENHGYLTTREWHREITNYKKKTRETDKNGSMVGSQLHRCRRIILRTWEAWQYN